MPESPYSGLKEVIEGLAKEEKSKALSVVLNDFFFKDYQRPITRKFVNTLQNNLDNHENLEKIIETERSELKFARIGLRAPNILPIANLDSVAKLIFHKRGTYTEAKKIDYSDSDPGEDLLPKPFWEKSYNKNKKRWRVRNYSKKDWKQGRNFVNNYISERELCILLSEDKNKNLSGEAVQILNTVSKKQWRQSTTIVTALMVRHSAFKKEGRELDRPNDHVGMIKKIAFLNSPLQESWFGDARKAAEKLGYHLVYSSKSHAEEALIRFHAVRPQYKLLGMGCDKEHCADCHALLKLHYGNKYPTLSTNSEKVFKNYYMPPTAFFVSQRNFTKSFSENRNIPKTSGNIPAYTENYLKKTEKMLNLSFRPNAGHESIIPVVFDQIRRHCRARDIKVEVNQFATTVFVELFKNVNFKDRKSIRELSVSISNFLFDATKQRYFIVFFHSTCNKKYEMIEHLDMREIYPEYCSLDFPERQEFLPIQIALIENLYYSEIDRIENELELENEVDNNIPQKLLDLLTESETDSDTDSEESSFSSGHS